MAIQLHAEEDLSIPLCEPVLDKIGSGRTFHLIHYFFSC
jgi:hypothetical protein